MAAATNEVSAGLGIVPRPAKQRLMRRSFFMTREPGHENASFMALQLLGWIHLLQTATRRR
jgi:hypothetical protein